MKKLIFALATVAFLGGFLGQSSAAKADLSISATFPTGGGEVSLVSAAPVYYAPPVVREPIYVGYRHDDWRYRHDHFDRHDFRDHRDHHYYHHYN